MTTRWAPEKRDVLRELATELLHNYGRGRALVAVDATRVYGSPVAMVREAFASVFGRRGSQSA